MGNARATLFEQPLVFVDIETNGLSYVRGKVIEVAAIRVEHGVVTKTFSSLVDPESELPQFITNLTGITTNDVKQAPTFHQLADELASVLEDAILVAHNVRFDYSFLKQEFKRLNRPFLPKQLCTVRLSRALYPHEKSHKLEHVIQRCNLTYRRRHRAYDDADVLWQFLQHLDKHFPPEQVMAAVMQQIKSPAMPRNLPPDLVHGLPEGPGVYIFEDETGQPLYVGKSVNIRQRVMSHFGRDHAETKEFKIAQAVKHIRTEQTPGELAALLLESKLVKELQPVYNRQLRRLSKLMLVRQSTNDAGYLTLILDEASVIDAQEASSILAVYPHRGRAKEALNEVVKTFDLCPKLMGLEKPRSACFLYQLHKCRGACVGAELPAAYNRRLLAAFEHQRIHEWPFQGPILLEEKTEYTHHTALVVDKWCVLGELSQDPYCEPAFTPGDAVFDLDTYTILKSYLAHKLQHLRIHLLEPHFLAQLGLS